MEIYKILQKHGQLHIEKDIEKLPLKEVDSLCKKLKNVDQYLTNLDNKDTRKLGKILPYNEVSECLESHKKHGKQLLEQGLVGCILLAGGQGTRLGLKKPKGLFKVKSLGNKTLFEIYTDKVKDAQKSYNCTIPLAIMLNPESYVEVTEFFKENKFFGLTQVDFFIQGMLPYFDDSHKWIWNKESIAFASEGNGKVFYHFALSPIFSKWKEKGVVDVGVIAIDNPLANPFNPSLIGLNYQNDLVIECIPKDKGKMGGVVFEDEVPSIVEYIFLEDKPSIPVHFSNTGTYVLKMSYIEKIANLPLPFHKIKKEVSSGMFANKYECFILDAFRFTKKIKTYKTSREENYAPLKTKNDIDLLNDLLKQQKLTF